MNKEIVFYFKNGNNKYAVYKVDDEYFAEKLVGDIVTNKLTNEEKELVNSVFSKMCVTNDLLDLGLFPFMGKKYRHYYDKINSWHTFTMEDGSSVPTQIVAKLNNLFNYQDNVVYENGSNKEKDFIKRIVEVGKKTLLVFMSATTVIMGGCAIKNTEIVVEKESEPINTEEFQKKEVLEFHDNKLLHIIDDELVIEDDNLKQSIDLLLDKQLVELTEDAKIFDEELTEDLGNNGNEKQEKYEEPSEDLASDNYTEIPEVSYQSVDEFRNHILSNCDESLIFGITNLLDNPIVSFNTSSMTLDDESVTYTTREDRIKMQIEFVESLSISDDDKTYLINYLKEKNNEAYEKVNRNINIIKSKSLNEKADMLMQIIKENDKLSEEEKSLFLRNPDVFYQNAAYFDYDSVVFNLMNLEVKYINDRNGSIAGDFIADVNGKSIIRIYNSTCFQDAGKDTLTHEFCHSLETSINRNYDFSVLCEIVNVNFNTEYFCSLDYNDLMGYGYDSGYTGLSKYFKVFAEIINPETLKKYHSTQNIEEIKKEFMSIIPDEAMFYKMCSNLDILRANLFTSDLNVEDTKILLNEVNDILGKYYTAKTGKKVEENLEIFSRLDYKGFISSLPDNIKYSFSEETILFSNEKSYMNVNNPNYMVSTSLKYPKTVTTQYVENDIERALYFGYIYEQDGNYYSNNPDIKIENDVVYVPQYIVTEYNYISLDEIQSNDLNR